MKYRICILIFLFPLLVKSQSYTKQDSLRGMVGPARDWWDLTYYHLDIEVLPEAKAIEGSVRIDYKVLRQDSILQIDLQKPLIISDIQQDGQSLSFETMGNTHFVTLQKDQKLNSFQSIKVLYSGKPREAVRAPWDGGISWKKDEKGNHFIASSCQGLGASVWWPCKDHMYDEVDSMLISVEVPEHLVDVSNGRLMKVEENTDKSTKTYHWFVNNPINNYGVNINIGDYARWGDTYQGEKGDLDVTYWALTQDKKKAKKQFKQVIKTLEAFEYWMGPYPFYEDGYQLVQAPYLGMEHQSSVTYGNGFKNGYLGRDLSGTGQGLKFDFIIIHESGHEWFANNITHQDPADMWIHESFTSYSESLYLEYHFGKKSGQEYVIGTRKNVKNNSPLIGDYDVNYEHPDTDIYYKGANVLNMIRQIISDDEKWRQILRGLGEQFYHQTLNSEQIEEYMTGQSSINLSPIFNQYLRSVRLPRFEYQWEDERLSYRWTDCLSDFAMPIDLTIDGRDLRLNPTTEWQQVEMAPGDLVVHEAYYVIY